jgi:hypothetical protein
VRKTRGSMLAPEWSLPPRATTVSPLAAWPTIRDRLPSASGQGLRQGPRPALVRLVLVLYLATLVTDVVRKVTGLSAAATGVLYVITVLVYATALVSAVSRGRATPRTLPVWLLMLSLWCLAVALAERIPPGMALLGWTSYVFFVPLAYVGAELAADDRLAARVFRVVTVGGAVVGVGAIASAIMGQSAPAVLQPLSPTVGIHTFSAGNIYLAPSVFASAEEASEQLLIALFAWAALAHLRAGRLRRIPSTLLGVLIIIGLLVTARRTDIDVAIAGIIAVLILGRIKRSGPTRPAAARDTARTRYRLGAAVVLAAVGSTGLVLLLGANTLVSFLLSGSAGSRIALMFSLTNSGSPLGQGPGTSTQGVAVLGAQSLVGLPQGSHATYLLNGRTFLVVEGGLAKTWIELGIMGLMLYGAVFWTALSPAVRSLRRMDGVGIALTMLAIALGVVFLKGHQSLDNPLIQPLFWLAVGGIWGRVHAGSPQA